MREVSPGAGLVAQVTDPRLVSWDLETKRFEAGAMVPEPVCMSYQWAGDPSPSLVHAMDGAMDLVIRWLEDPAVIHVGQNLAGFDLLVVANHSPRGLAAVLFALDGGRIRDTQLREYLITTRTGQRQGQPKGYFSLVGMAERYLGVTLAKGEDTWRKRYGDLIHTPLAAWPEDARSYALLDASTTARVFEAQHTALTALDYLDPAAPWCAVTEREQARAAFALEVISAWGIHTSAEKVRALAEHLQARLTALEPALLAPTDAGTLRAVFALLDSGALPGEGLADKIRSMRERGVVPAVLRPKSKKDPTPSRDMAWLRALIVLAHQRAELEIPMTDGGKAGDNPQVATGGDVIQAVAGFCPALEHLSEYLHCQKILSTFVSAAAEGIEKPLHTRFTSVMVTNRTSSSGPNLQNLPREKGVRQCFVPRPGAVFSSCDYATLEMRTHAQVCLDWGLDSALAVALREGRDPHVEFGAAMAAAAGDDWGALSKGARADYRQRAKAGNFGFPGGLGAARMVDYAQAYGVNLTVSVAKDLKAQWLRAWPEMRPYFARISALERGGFIDVTMPRSGMIRGAARYTEACNFTFQGLAAYGAKAALYAVVKECLTAQPGDALYGSHVVNFIHDELLTEHPEAVAARAAERVAEIMRIEMERVTPDVPQVVKPTLMRCWDKEAKPVFDDSGKLIPWGGVDG